MRRLLALALLLCAFGAHAASPTLSCTIPRTSGVAPLSVFVDCTGSTDADTTAPFHDLHFEHSFGDTNAGNWTAGGVTRKRNFATGAIAGHVYETAGTYKITTVVTDGANTARTTNTITVTAADTVFSGTNTVCFSNDATFTGCPAGATQVTTSNFTTAISGYQATHKRMLFRRGNTFDIPTTTAILNTAGPGILGAFGTGAQPIVTGTNNGMMLRLSGLTTATIEDWRIMDIDFNGLNGGGTEAIEAEGGIDKVTIINNTFRDVFNGIIFSRSVIDADIAAGYPLHELWDQIFIVNNTIDTISTNTNGWRVLIGAQRSAIMGNTLGDTVNASGSGSHVIRATNVHKFIISNNLIARSQINLAIKLHGPAWCENNSPPGTCTVYDNVTPPANYNYSNNTHPIGVEAPLSGYTEYVLISDNKMIGAGSVYLMVSGPQNQTMEERVRDVIIERNWFVGGTAVQSAVNIHSFDTTVRNNICDLTSTTSGSRCFSLERYGNSPAPPPQTNKVYNNTAYRSNTATSFTMVRIDTITISPSVKNNLAYAPLAGTTTMLSGSGASGLVASGNSTNAQTKSTDPLFSGPNTTPDGFRIGTASYAVNLGDNSFPPSYSDFYNCTDKQGFFRAGAFVPKAYARCRNTK
jgi:hypothetical protein